MSDYQPGTVAVATVRGRENVRVFCDDWDSWRHADIIGFRQTRSAFVTDVRPLVVLDLADVDQHIASKVANIIRIAGESTFMEDSPQLAALKTIADQIEAQAKPPRIPEPGLWGVVEANVEGWTDGPSRFVNYGGSWIAKSPFGTKHASWSDLIDPTLIREGVESDA